MSFKRIIAIGLALLMMFALVSCGDKEPSKKTGGEKTANDDTGFSLTPTDDNIVGWLWSDDPEDVEIAGFARTYPDYKLDHSTRNSGVFEDKSNDLPRLFASIASETQPDIYWGWNTPTEAFYTDLFMPIQEYIDNDPDFHEEDIRPAALEVLKFNDKLYFMTNEYSAFMFVWNRDIFKNAGLDPDTPPKTWDEFYDYAEKCTTYHPSGALKTIGAEQKNFSIEHWYSCYTGKTLVDKTGLKFDYNNPEMLKTLEFADSLSNMYGGYEKLGSGLWWFAVNNVGMTQWGGAYISGVNSSVGDIPLPEENSERHLLGRHGPFMGIPRDAKNPLGGWLAMKYFCTDGVVERELANYNNEVEVYIPRYGIHIPTHEKLVQIFTEYLDDVRFKNYEIRNALLDTIDVPAFSSPLKTDIDKFITDNKEKVYKGEMASQDFLKELQSYAENITAEFVKQKEEEGWKFTEDGAIPPSEQ